MRIDKNFTKSSKHKRPRASFLNPHTKKFGTPGKMAASVSKQAANAYWCHHCARSYANSNWYFFTTRSGASRMTPTFDWLEKDSRKRDLQEFRFLQVYARSKVGEKMMEMTKIRMTSEVEDPHYHQMEGTRVMTAEMDPKEAWGGLPTWCKIFAFQF